MNRVPKGMRPENLNDFKENPAMRTMVGVDANDLYVPAVDLLGRLRFAGNRAIMAHIDSAPLAASIPVAPGVAGLAERGAPAWHVLLDTARDRARAAGLDDSPETMFATGNSSVSLLNLADEARADLVAIGSRRQGALSSAFLGSVGRALAIGAPQSFLVARGTPKGTGKVRAVFATDHSDYANRCFTRLLAMNPLGLEHVTVMTAIESDSLVDEQGTLGQKENELWAKGDKMAERLILRGISASFRLAEGAPQEAIRRTMVETEADLLILGARGRGLIERVLIGSLALHTVVAEPYPVLVLRLPEE